MNSDDDDIEMIVNELNSERPKPQSKGLEDKIEGLSAVRPIKERKCKQLNNAIKEPSSEDESEAFSDGE